ncbi:MAG: Holliday junction resolvase RuvX [Alphaproteobacteria bacterium GM202ARS2]|nr:Holliday junction resolvase RuvX [Alphaproteobacteria bacterium GM202ARS2]
MSSVSKQPERFSREVAANKRLLALDYGLARTGMALSDKRWRVAVPLGVIHARQWGHIIEHLRPIVAEHHVGGFIVGLPLRWDGQEGEQCARTRTFAVRAHKAFDLPVLLVDERYSSSAAERLHKEGLEKKRAPLPQDSHHDARAAAWILQDALDRYKHLAGGG